MEKAKIFCHTCDGKKFVDEKAYPSGEILSVQCPECDGKGYTEVEKAREEKKT